MRKNASTTDPKIMRNSGRPLKDDAEPATDVKGNAEGISISRLSNVRVSGPEKSDLTKKIEIGR